jgi:hypothetical protein
MKESHVGKGHTASNTHAGLSYVERNEHPKDQREDSAD